ncbi:MAG TPA: aconitase X catalytic domain-containing protein [Actinomycetota bacterium]|nr:aconitase X catalytic domain-containing protein [Actinomycetota bacterium]
MPQLNPTPEERALLSGSGGPGAALAMRIVSRMAEVTGAERLLPAASAHIDGCLDHGPAGLEFVERLVEGGARVAVPTTLNVGSLDLLHPGLYRGDRATAARARRLMDAYVELGCRPTWTCAPYQLPEARPRLGEHVAWAESNAIVFANSVLGARTDRYGDFIDISAAITARVPDAGLHRDENRRAETVFRLEGVPSRLLDRDVIYPVLGHLIGREARSAVAALVGLPGPVSEDRLKALGAAAASSGGLGLVHVVGVTPEAPTLDAALGGRPPVRELAVTPARLAAARDELNTAPDGPVGAVSVGTPHFSVAEFERLVPLVREHPPHVPFYVSTARAVLSQVDATGWLAELEAAGVRLVVDTCTYVTPILGPVEGPVMTDSAKWAYYAPGNLGVEVVFGSLEECVVSAARGRVWRDPHLWDGA